MATTVASVIAKVKRYFSQVQDPVVLEALNNVHPQIEIDIDLSGTTESINLTANFREFAYSVLDIKIWQVRYVRSATTGDYINLTATSWDELHGTDPEWLRYTAGEPLQYYVRHGNIGLDRLAPTTTSGGYPVLQLDVSRTSPLTDIGNMPEASTHMAWVWGACEELAAMYNDPRLNYYTEKRIEAMRQLEELMQNKAGRYQPQRLSPGTSISHIPRV